MQGFNMGRYVPPDKEGVTSGNALHRKRTAPATVRFEMPFAVWCGTCPQPTIIGQGVRFNATKTRVGNYHSTAVWAFRFRHAACGGELEVRTDPKNTAYVVTEGGKKRDVGDGKAREDEEEVEGGVKILTDAEREELRKSAFKRLERTIEDREAAKLGNERIEGLLDRADRDWGDPYLRNQRLRRTFRDGRKEREREAEGDRAMRKRLGLAGDGDESDDDEAALKILPATKEDELRAALVEFGPQGQDDSGQRALARPLFSHGCSVTSDKPRNGQSKTKGVKPAAAAPVITATTTKAEAAAQRRKGELVSRIAGNTRAATDPFLNDFGVAKPSSGSRMLLPGVKRKRAALAEEPAIGGDEDGVDARPPSSAKAVATLVDYDSE